MENDILAISALVASYVGIFKLFGLQTKWYSIVALLVASVFVLVPDYIKQQVITISTIGLTATGAYQYAKNKGGKDNDTK